MTYEEKKLLQEVLAERVAHFRACGKHVHDNWMGGDSGYKEATEKRYNETADTLEGIAEQLTFPAKE